MEWRKLNQIRLKTVPLSRFLNNVRKVSIRHQTQIEVPLILSFKINHKLPK